MQDRSKALAAAAATATTRVIPGVRSRATGGPADGQRRPLLSPDDPDRQGLIAAFRVLPQTPRVTEDRRNSNLQSCVVEPLQRPVPPASRAPRAATDTNAADEVWVWLHFDQNNPRTHEWLHETSGIPPAAIEGLLAEQTRPRMIDMDEGVLFIGRGVNLNPNADPTDMVSIRAWVETNRLVTVILRPVQSTAELVTTFECLAAGESAPTGATVSPHSAATVSIAVRGPMHLLFAINRRMVDRMVPLVEKMSDDLEDLVVSVVDADVVITADELAPIRLQLITLHRYLAPLREAFVHCSELEHEAMHETLEVHFREIADRVTRVVEELAAAQNRAAVARDEIASEADERLNRRVFALAVLTAIFLPLTVLTGLLGINVAGIPGSENPMAFAFVTLLLLIILAAQILILKWLKWF